MKKFLKIIIFLLIFCIVIFIMNLVRNYLILNKIYDAGNNFQCGNNFHINEVAITEMSTTITDYYYKDGKYLLVVEYPNGKDIYSYDNDKYHAFTIDENENIIINETENPNNYTDYIDMITYCKAYEFEYLLKKHLFRFIKEKENCYILLSEKETEIYVNKETGLMEKMISINLGYDIRFTFEKDSVEDDDINKYN